MAKFRQEDLFANSTMTFGEHLEELRLCLTRAVVGVLLGCIVGLFIANPVVRWIRTPVAAALSRHNVEVAKDELKAKYPTSDEMVRVIDENVLVVDEVYVEESEVARIGVMTSELSPPNDQAASSKTPEKQPGSGLDATLPSPTPHFIKTRIWRRAEAKIQSLNPYETFIIYIKAALVIGVVISSPYLFLQIWTFVAAGLYPHEKNYVYLFLPISLTLFLGGAALAFFFVFQPVLDFLFGYNRRMNIVPDMRINDVISFVLLLPLGFGISFQLPLVMFFVNRIGLVSLSTLVEKWRIAILLIFIISMVLTPSGDPFSMSLMALPLTGLYFLGIGMIKWLPKQKNPFAEE